MPNFSKVTIIGHLGQNPELRTLDNQQQVANFSVAVTHKVKDNQQTVWYKISCWGKQAEIAEKYLAKGNAVMIEGRLSIREYTSQSGEKGISVEVSATDLVLLGNKQDAENGGSQQQKPAEQQGEWTPADEDTPF
jgi:single-strand DNA-binding protein